MAFLNFLNNLSGAIPGMGQFANASPGFAGGMIPIGGQPRFGGGPNPDGSMSLGGPGMIEGLGGLENALAQNQAMGQQQQAGPHKQKLGLLGILGMLGDAARGYKGQDPIYGPRMLAKQEKQQRNAALSNYLDNPQEAIRALLAAGDPMGIELLKSQQGEGFTLGEGQARYDSKGKLIASGQNKLDTVEIDGVVFDKRTGEPLFESPYSRIIPGAEGSFFEQPRKGLGRGRPSPQGGGDLRAQAEEAIRMGADPAEVNKRLQEMTGGATAGPSPIFP